MTAEIKASLLALQHHTGFKYLCSRLANKREEFERTIFNAHFDNIHDYYNLQAKIGALKFFQAEIKRVINEATPEGVPEFKFPESTSPEDVLARVQGARDMLPLERERAAFAEAQKHIELVGGPN